MNDNIKMAMGIIFILEFVTCILRFSKYISWYNNGISNFFYYELENYRGNMTEGSYFALSHIGHEFPKYSDSSGFVNGIDQLLAGMIMGFSIFNSLIALICLSYDKRSCTMCCYIFSTLFCIIGNSMYFQYDRSLVPTITLAVTSVSKEEIDKDTLSKWDLNNILDYYYYGRKKWLKFYSIAILLECIIQIILIIKYYYYNKTPNYIREFVKPSDSSSTNGITDA